MSKYWQNFNFLVKTKNVPKGLKCKINTKKILDKGFPKGGGGGPTFGKNSQIISFFFESVPNISVPREKMQV